MSKMCSSTVLVRIYAPLTADVINKKWKKTNKKNIINEGFHRLFSTFWVEPGCVLFENKMLVLFLSVTSVLWSIPQSQNVRSIQHLIWPAWDWSRVIRLSGSACNLEDVMRADLWRLYFPLGSSYSALILSLQSCSNLWDLDVTYVPWTNLYSTWSLHNSQKNKLVSFWALGIPSCVC